MRLLSRFRRKKGPSNVEVPKDIQEALRAKMEEFENAKPAGCPHRFIFEQMRFCDRPLLEGSNFCFWHTPSTAKYDPKVMQKYFGDSRTLKQAVEQEVAAGSSLSGAFLKGAAIGGNWFERGADLSRSHLDFANLSDAHMSYGSLKGATLVGTNLESAYLSNVDIRDANFSLARLYNVKFRDNEFTGVKGLTKESFRGWKWRFFPVYRILEEYPDQSEAAYRSLVAYFSSRVALDDASWAAYRSRVAHRELLKKEVTPLSNVIQMAIRDHFVPGERLNKERVILLACMRSVSRVLAVAQSYISCFAFGYGEKPFRVLLLSGFTIISYAALFNWLRALPEQGFGTALYFSIVTFTTLGYGDLAPRKEFRLLAASEALLGVLLVGLFLFTLSRRAVGRG